MSIEPHYPHYSDRLDVNHVKVRTVMLLMARRKVSVILSSETAPLLLLHVGHR